MSYQCSICGKLFTCGFQDAQGRLFCSQKCYESTWPKCAICGKYMQKWMQDSEGRRYCSQTCYEKTWPKCAVCGKPVNGGLKDKQGHVYCSEYCYERSLPTCTVCGKRMKQWIVTEDGKKYCSDECFQSTLPKCSICGKTVISGFTDDKNRYYCSKECYEQSLPRCSVCGKPFQKGWQDETGHLFCSEHCYNTTLPHCTCCGKPMKQWYVVDENHLFCSQECIDSFKKRENKKTEIDMESTLTSKELAYLTGLKEADCERFMFVNHLNGDEALEAIDIFMDSLNDNIAVPAEIASCVKNAEIYSQLASHLSAYNTMRGGTKGYGGFVFEELHAADATSKGINIQVLANNGPADFITIDSSGNQTLIQAKAGYKPHQIDWSKYQGQKIIVDKGNTALAEDARSAGLMVEESAVYKSQADILARAQQWESKITGQTTAPITATAASSYYAGLASAKFAARVGVSMQLGATIYDVLAGNKSFEEGAADLIVDGAVTVGGAFVGGAALNLAGTAGTTAATAISGSVIGTAISGTVSGVGAALGNTAVGGAIISGSATIATGIGTAITAVASAPLAPVIVIGTAIGFLGKWLRD